MASRYDVSGKVVLITGAARGIGAETARLLAGKGARLALVGLEPELMDKLAGELGPDHKAFTADVTSQDQLDQAVNDVIGHFGGIDVVVANAGVASYGTVRQIDPEAFARTVDINLTGVFRTIHAAIPHVLERKGYVLILASLASFTPLAGMASYNASKSGVEAFGLAFRQEVKHLGVDVGICHPSWIDTDLVRGALDDIPTFRRIKKLLPWPANTTTSVEECARRIAQGIENRSGRVYIPQGVLIANLTRAIVSSPLGFLVIRRQLAKNVPNLEDEIHDLGRSFAAHVPSAED